MVLEKMEFSRIKNMVFKSAEAQPTTATTFLNDGHGRRKLVMMDGGGNPGFDFVPFHQTTEPRILILDDNGILREAFTDVSYLLANNLPSYAPDDTEIPPHVLDHMYAKKPREPGSEQTPAKPRRKAKRKEQVVDQFIIPDIYPPAPKINIIRQRLPSGVCKSLPSRPKILYGSGSPQKASSTNSTGYGNSSPVTSPTKGKSTPSKQGRTHKKDEPSKTMYASFDEVNKLFTSNKFGKDSKSLKPTSKSASNPSTIIMDDLQRVGAAYDEEMLFDFGITEDDDNDEAITCTLGTDGFSDGEFDEFSGMEVFDNANQSCLKASSLSKSPIPTSGILLNQRSHIKSSTHPKLPSEISDDDDSNQIMVSIHNHRRSSQDWDSVQLFDQPIKQEAVTISQSSLSDSCVATNKQNNKCVSQIKNKPSVDLKLSEVLKKQSAINGAGAVTIKEGFLFENTDSAALTTLIKNESPEKSPATTNLAPTTRRSSRVVKTPAWLEDSDKSHIAKRRRKKSSA